MGKNRKLFLSLAAFLLVGSFSARSVSAEITGLSIDTSVLMLRMEPGKELRFSFDVKNQMNDAQNINLKEKDIAIGNDNNFIFLDAADGPSSWVTFDQNDFVLQPQQAKTVIGTMQIPSGQTNTFAMMTLVTFSSQNSLPESGPKVSGSVGVYEILSGKDAKNPMGKIEKLTSLKMINDSIDVEVVYANIGDVQFIPGARVSATNFLLRDKVEFPFDNHFVFPGKTFTFKKNIPNLSPWWAYEIKASFKDGNGKLLEKSVFAFGKFFPIVFFLALTLGVFLARRLLEIRRKNSRQQ
ncbi:MAG: hypothetical protein PHW24_04885 [Candidatus Moranbacteria bacterium]|nr:hypothetical protein [Candidatus Moranbacteria bacterium]